MKKIPTLFQRDRADHLLRDFVTPGCEWVLIGEGVATIKWDGTPMLYQGGRRWKRYDVKIGRKVPEGAIACEPGPDPGSGHWPHWVPIGEGKDDAAFREAGPVPPGWQEGATYEVLGPKVQGNPYHLPRHEAHKHGLDLLLHRSGDNPRTFEAIRAYLSEHHVEGIVWHRGDGRCAKVKRVDFGLEWPASQNDTKGNP